MTDPFAILAVAVIGLPLAGGLILLAFGKGPGRLRALADTLRRIQPLPLWALGPIAALWLILFLPIFIALVRLLLTSFESVESRNFTELRWHYLAIVGLVGAIGGVVGFPIALIRMHTTERQTKAAEDQRDHNDLVQVNARLQSALEQLSARYSETRIGRNVTAKTGDTTDTLLEWQDDPLDRATFDDFTPEKWQAFTFDAPDRQTRLAGIGQFSAIAAEAAERPELRRRINEHLATFLRANAPAAIAEDPPAPTEPDMSPEDRARQLRDWAGTLRPHADAQAAIALIGASDNDDDLKGLDLRRIRLQGTELEVLNLKACRLTETRLEGAVLHRAHLEGANLVGAHLEGANLGEAHLEGADLGEAHLEGAVLWEAHLEGADLWGARLEGARLVGAHLEGAVLWEAHLEGADLRGAHLEGANLLGAHLEGAVLWEADLEGADLGEAHLEGADLWEAHLEGADLREAHLEGADLGGAHLDTSTRFSPASLRGAGLKRVDYTIIPDLDADFSESFGDGSVKLPANLRPGHWPTEVLNDAEFKTQWRAFQKKIGYTPPDSES